MQHQAYTGLAAMQCSDFEKDWSSPDLTMILILPAAPEEVAFEDSPGPDVAFGEHLQVKSIEILQKAFGPRLFIGAPAQPRAVAPDGRRFASGGDDGAVRGREALEALELGGVAQRRDAQQH